MKKTLYASALALSFGLAGCVPGAPVSPLLTAAEMQVCKTIAGYPAAVQALLDRQDPHSTVGSLWINAKAGCMGAAPAPGVAPDWTGMVFGELKAVAPKLLPVLIGLL